MQNYWNNVDLTAGRRKNPKNPANLISNKKIFLGFLSFVPCGGVEVTAVQWGLQRQMKRKYLYAYAHSQKKIMKSMRRGIFAEGEKQSVARWEMAPPPRSRIPSESSASDKRGRAMSEKKGVNGFIVRIFFQLNHK